MSTVESADVVVVGSGPCGVLVARELVRAGREVLLLERGGMKSHKQQLVDGVHEADTPGSKPNHESAPDQEPYPWDYVYGVGGASLHWAGVAPRFLPSDFELRSRYDVGRDWPFSYEHLEPFYDEAEQALGVSGGPNPLWKDRKPYPQPPHRRAPVDRLVGPMLEPYHAAPQARPTESIHGRASCCGSARCSLCPVDARYSALHTLDDERMRERKNFELRTERTVARLRTRAGRVTEIEALDRNGTLSRIRPKTVVLAANGLENPAILLRSGLDGPDVGRWLYDHEHRLIYLRINRDARHGYGDSLATGVSYAFVEGEFRSKRGSLLVYPYNPGRLVTEDIKNEMIAGHTGADLQRRVRDLFDHTLVLDSIGEDLPRRERRIELSPNKGEFGLPMNRIHYSLDGEYLERTRRWVLDELGRRLSSLSPKVEKVFPVAQGAHSLGTCYMGESEGVVDPNLRHHDFENLYIAGGSALPTYSAHHPTLTIAALGIRLGRHLVEHTQ